MAQDYLSCNGEDSAHGNDAIRHLKQSIADGKPWHIALLEAIALWTRPDENYNGNRYCYLIHGEAFDWLLLAERLCQEVADAIPEDEMQALLFFGRLPEEISEEEFRELLGSAKYHAYLNYLYGVTIERFILLAVEDEIRKERQVCVFSCEKGDLDDGYERLYGSSEKTLLRLFRQEKGYRQSKDININELKEFTYWLFKYRLKNCDKERVASDTKKGVEFLELQNLGTRMLAGHEKSSYVIDHIHGSD